MVRREMEATYGRDKVAAVNVVTDTRKLDPLLNKYNTTKQKLDDLTSNYSEWDSQHHLVLVHQHLGGAFWRGHV